jgi:phosphoglycolate phosphatase
MPIRAILFDKDGTLVDFQRTWGPAIHDVMRHYADGDDAILTKLAAVNRFVLDGDRFLPDSPLIAEPPSLYGKLWAQVLGRPANGDFIAELDRLFLAASTDDLVPIGDPPAILGALAARGCRLGLFTNDAEASGRTHAARLGIDGLLSFVGGYDSGFGAKPEPGPVLAFAEAVGARPEEVAVVGDTLHDLAAARAAGAVAVGVLSGLATAGVLAPEADALLPSIASLPGWLSSLS